MPAKVFHAHLYGTRKHKYAELRDSSIALTEWSEADPDSPFYLFVPQDTQLLSSYERGWQITTSMPVNVLGFQTHRDAFAIDFDRAPLRSRIQEMRSEETAGHLFLDKYALDTSRGWRFHDARRRLMDDSRWEAWLVQCLYRPFDVRWCYLSDTVMDRPRPQIQQHIVGRPNLCLLSSRQQATVGYKHCLVSRWAPNDCVVSTKSREANQAFFLYLYPSGEPKQRALAYERAWPVGHRDRVPNLSSEFVAAMADRLGLEFVPDGVGDLERTFGPEDVFHYIYAVFHSPAYRERYAEFLKIDFPRVPLTSDVGLFRALCGLGADLVALHLLEDDYPHASWTREDTAPPLQNLITRYPVPGDNTVEKGHPKYLVPGTPEPVTHNPLPAGRVYISKDSEKAGTQGRYFDGVPPEVWAFHVGGYQVCDKWLKDRRGRQLTFEDLTHYQRVLVALKETIRLMAEIDAAVDAHGGWPIQ